MAVCFCVERCGVGERLMRGVCAGRQDATQRGGQEVESRCDEKGLVAQKCERVEADCRV